MCKGEAHGDFERRIMPADSNLLNSALVICHFSGFETVGFWENRRVATCVDVSSTPWVGVGFTSMVRKIAGNFFNKALTSAGTESGIICKEGGGSNRDWFSQELKLDDFTWGFRTTCAGMAGGWEEVVAVCSWIGTELGPVES